MLAPPFRQRMSKRKPKKIVGGYDMLKHVLTCPACGRPMGTEKEVWQVVAYCFNGGCELSGERYAVTGAAVTMEKGRPDKPF